jgi:hypothetical protein
VEKTRHFLLLRERLGDSIPKSLSDSLSPSLSSGTLSTSTSISSQISTTTFESAITPSESSGYDSADIESLVDREKELATKVGIPSSWLSIPLQGFQLFSQLSHFQHFEGHWLKAYATL